MPDSSNDLLRSVSAVIDAVQAIDLRIPVDKGHLSIEPDLVAEILDLLREAARVLGLVARHCEGRGGGEIEEVRKREPFPGANDLISTGLAAREVADLALVGRSEMLDIHHDLSSAIAEHNRWKIAAQAEAGVVRPPRTLIPIESALREDEGLSPKKRRWENLEHALEVRRQYGMLWRTVLRAGKPTGPEVRPALKQIADRIAVLRNLKIYPTLRVGDRLKLRSLQKRIVVFLHDRDGEPGVTGEELWSDVAALFSLLVEINNCPELREHDRQMATNLNAELRRARLPEAISQEILVRLEDLMGRDHDLDRILVEPDHFRQQDLRAPLARIRERLTEEPYRRPESSRALR